MEHAVNRIARSNQATPGAEGSVLDGAAGSQMAFCPCRESAASAAHSNDYDEVHDCRAGPVHLTHRRKRNSPCAPVSNTSEACCTAVKSWQAPGQFTHWAGMGRSGFGDLKDYYVRRPFRGQVRPLRDQRHSEIV